MNDSSRGSCAVCLILVLQEIGGFNSLLWDSGLWVAFDTNVGKSCLIMSSLYCHCERPSLRARRNGRRVTGHPMVGRLEGRVKGSTIAKVGKGVVWSDKLNLRNCVSDRAML